MVDKAQRWDERYRDRTVADAAPARVLSENQHLLPSQGQALELACGLGGNARLLAERGVRTCAWDLSPVAVAKLDAFGRQWGLPLTAAVRDVDAEPPAPETADVLVVTRFLSRPLVPYLLASLRRHGLIFYQTFIQEAPDWEVGPSNPEYRLHPNELLSLFEPLRCLVYREEGGVGDVAQGWRSEALYVGQKIERGGRP